MFGGRSPSTILGAVFQRQHYVALRNMRRVYPAFWGNLWRYLSGRGEYPRKVEVRVPFGVVRPVLHTRHDLLTVNEIFCRKDYPADATDEVVLDVGSNIGISALYFLTRNETSRCYLFEPDKRNVEKLKHNLAGFEPRYRLREEAVSDIGGILQFGIESTGRYGGIGVETGERIEVECRAINDVLREILAEEDAIDILKIDTEGVEIKTVEAIEKSLARRIRKIYLEAEPGGRLHPDVFDQRQYGSVCQLTNKALRK